MRRVTFVAEIGVSHPLFTYLDSISLAKFHLNDGTDLYVDHEGGSCETKDGYLYLTWYRPFSRNDFDKDYTISRLPMSDLLILLADATVEFVLDSCAPKDLDFGEITYSFEGDEH